MKVKIISLGKIGENEKAEEDIINKFIKNKKIINIKYLYYYNQILIMYKEIKQMERGKGK